MHLETQFFNHKLRNATYVLLFMLALILLRLIHLQIILNRHLSLQSKKNFLRSENITPLRGNILDSSGILLATNRPTTNIFWVGTGNRVFSNDQWHALSKLEAILGKPLIQDEIFLKELRYAEKRYQQFPLAFDIPFEQLSQLVEQLPNQKNISIVTHFKRHYPFKSWSCHLLGYLTRMDMETYGKMGLEKICEDTLKGQLGEKLKTINSFGRNLAEVEVKKAEAGQSIATTLDLTLQTIVEEIFPEEYAGTFIVMDPEDGGLRAVLSRPGFDPAIFLDPLDHEEWLALQEKQPFLNRAFNAAYPPGSIFKLVTMSALLEHNFIGYDSSWYCKGYVDFCGRQYWCNNRKGHGWLSAQDALAHSCNTPFFEAGKRVPIDTLADYAHRFGLGEKTNIIFAEKEGLIPTASWKKKVKKERWWTGDTLSVAIGQSYLLVTPIQIARMISSIFTGHLVCPRVLMDQPIVKEPLRLKQETCQFLQQSMELVTRRGTAQPTGHIKNIRIYAKTSTAQTCSLDKRDLGNSYLEHGWFVGYFCYKNEKPLTLVILVENAGTSRVATQIAKNFLIRYKQMIDHPPTLSSS